MRPTIAVSTSDNSGKLTAALLTLTRKDVLVGIPQEKSSRKGDGPNNAELLYIHTHGSELRHIPARPVIEPAIEDAREPIAALLGHAADSILDEQPEAATTYLRAAGVRGMAAAKDWFTNPKNNWAPNTPATVRRKLRKVKGAVKAEALATLDSGESMVGVNTPLIDTGELRKSITYVMRDK